MEFARCSICLVAQRKQVNPGGGRTVTCHVTPPFLCSFLLTVPFFFYLLTCRFVLFSFDYLIQYQWFSKSAASMILLSCTVFDPLCLSNLRTGFDSWLFASLQPEIATSPPSSYLPQFSFASCHTASFDSAPLDPFVILYKCSPQSLVWL